MRGAVPTTSDPPPDGAVGRTGAEGLRAAVDSRSWYHTIELAPGVVTPGWFDTRELAGRVHLPDDLSGMRCLDVGTFDGFWAFEMERRGAAEVVALDVPDPSDWDWPHGSSVEARAAVAARHDAGRGFAIAHEALGSGAQREERNVYDLDPAAVGSFDLVYVGSLLLHLRDPVGALERVRSVCHGTFVLVEAIDEQLTRRHPARPVATLDGTDRPWWWTANAAGLARMVTSAGFTIAHGPERVRIPAGLGQGRVPLRPATLLTGAGRTALRRSRLGDPHAVVVSHPRN